MAQGALDACRVGAVFIKAKQLRRRVQPVDELEHRLVDLAVEELGLQLLEPVRPPADDAVSEGYLQHFEDVEGPLDKVDHELNEKLEDTIKGDLREKIKSGASVAEIARLIAAVDADLATAERKLK